MKYLLSKNEVSRLMLSKVTAQTDRNTDEWDQKHCS